MYNFQMYTANNTYSYLANRKEMKPCLSLYYALIGGPICLAILSN